MLEVIGFLAVVGLLTLTTCESRRVLLCLLPLAVLIAVCVAWVL